MMARFLLQELWQHTTLCIAIATVSSLHYSPKELFGLSSSPQPQHNATAASLQIATLPDNVSLQRTHEVLYAPKRAGDRA